MALSGIMNLFMPISAAINPNCDYYQNVELGQRYYIYNEEYPNLYPPRTSCRWVAHSPGNTKMILSCEDIDIPAVSYTNSSNHSIYFLFDRSQQLMTVPLNKFCLIQLSIINLQAPLQKVYKVGDINKIVYCYHDILKSNLFLSKSKMVSGFVNWKFCSRIVTLFIVAK